MVRQKLRINSSKLIEVILGVADKSCKHLSEKSSSYDFDLAIPYLKEQKLEDIFVFEIGT